MNECLIDLSDFAGTKSEKERLKTLLAMKDCLVSKDENDVGYTDTVTLSIQLTDETPMKQPYPLI